MIYSPQPQRIALVRALPGLGDLLCAVPAIRALRAALSRANITHIGLPGAQELAGRFNYLVDDFLEFPGFPGLPERPFEPQRFLNFVGHVHEIGFDLAIQMHGSEITSNPFTVLLGAKHNAGFYVPGNYCPDTSRFLPFDEQESEVRRYIRLMEHLGVPSQGEELEFPLHAEDFDGLASIEETRHLRPGGFASVHPGAKNPTRRWPPEYFAQLADRLADQGLQVVLTGTEGERRLTQSVARHMKVCPLDLTGVPTSGRWRPS